MTEQEVVFSKIAIKGEGSKTKVILHYTDDSGDWEGKPKGLPTDGFLTAMRKMDSLIADMCDFQNGFGDGAKVTTVSLSRRNELITLVLSATLLLSNGKAFNFNTPAYTEAADPDEPGIANLSGKALPLIDELVNRAHRHLDGEWSQIEMGLDNGQDDEDDAPDGSEEAPSDEKPPEDEDF